MTTPNIVDFGSGSNNNQPTFDPFEVDESQITQAISRKPHHPPKDTFSRPDLESLFSLAKTVLTHSTQFAEGSNTTPQSTTMNSFNDVKMPVLPCLLKQIAHAIMSCDNEYGSTAAHKTTMSISDILSDHSWEAEAVLALSSFAIEFGQISHLLYHIRKLTDPTANTDQEFFESLANLRSMIDFYSNPKSSDELTQINNIIRTVVQVMEAYFELTIHHASTQIPINVEIVHYWVTIAVVACATQLNMLTCRRPSNTLDDLTRYFEKVRTIQRSLEAATSSYPTLLEIIRKPNKDIVALLRAMFFIQSNTSSVLVNCGPNSPVEFKDLLNNKVYLLISGLEISTDDITRIMLIHKRMKQEHHHCKIVWVPIVEKFDSETESIFKNKRKQMEWLTLDIKVVTQTAGFRYIKEQKWYSQERTTLVVLNEKGEVENHDAFTLCIGPPELFPLGPVDLQQDWIKIVVGTMGVDDVNLWMKDGTLYSLFYGGTKQELIQTFKSNLEKLESHDQWTSSRISMKSYGLTQHTNFWRGVDSMHTLAKNNGKLANLTRQIEMLLSYKTQDGWVLLCQGSRPVIATHLSGMSYVVETNLLQTSFQIQKYNFEQTIKRWLNQAYQSKVPHPPSRLEIQCNSIDEQLHDKSCHVCGSRMLIKIIYECSHDNHQVTSVTNASKVSYKSMVTKNISANESMQEINNTTSSSIATTDQISTTSVKEKVMDKSE